MCQSPHNANANRRSGTARAAKYSVKSESVRTTCTSWIAPTTPGTRERFKPVRHGVYALFVGYQSDAFNVGAMNNQTSSVKDS
ncbi:hypothetical protein GCM10027610_117270 [Dactylosporangium cerinum]